MLKNKRARLPMVILAIAFSALVALVAAISHNLVTSTEPVRLLPEFNNLQRGNANVDKRRT